MRTSVLTRLSCQFEAVSDEDGRFWSASYPQGLSSNYPVFFVLSQKEKKTKVEREDTSVTDNQPIAVAVKQNKTKQKS